MKGGVLVRIIHVRGIVFINRSKSILNSVLKICQVGYYMDLLVLFVGGLML